MEEPSSKFVREAVDRDISRRASIDQEVLALLVSIAPIKLERLAQQQAPQRKVMAN